LKIFAALLCVTAALVTASAQTSLTQGQPIVVSPGGLVSSGLYLDASQFTNGTVGTCTPGTNDNICIANAIASISGNPGSTGGYAIIDATAMSATQTWTANPFAAIISNGTTNVTAPKKCGRLLISGGSTITMNQPFTALRCWDIEVVSQFGQAPNFVASSLWPGIYTTGTVTTSSPTLISTGQYQFTVTGSGTSFVANVVPGEEFTVCQGTNNPGANGPSCGGNGTTTCSVACGSNSAGQLTYGMVLAVTDNTHLIVGASSSNIAVANASGVNYVIKAPLVWLGAMGASGGDGGGAATHWLGGTLSCANMPGCSIFTNFSQQENTQVSNVVMTNTIDTYMDVEGVNAVNSGPYDRLVMNASSSCVASTMAIIARIPTITRPFQHFTVNFDACPATGGAVAIDWEEGGELWDGHYENTGNMGVTNIFVSVGENTGGTPSVTCPVVCVQPVNEAASAFIHGMNVTGTGLTGISLGSQPGTQILLADNTVSYTNVITDNARSCTIKNATGDSTIHLYEHLYNNGWLGTAQNAVNACGSGGTFSGTLTAGGVISGSTTFTSSGGLDETTLVGGATAGKFTTATVTSGSTVITMGGSISAPHGWHCSASDITHPTDIIVGTSASTTTAKLTVASAITAGDVIEFNCEGY
jgi:hypothetical protein